MCLPLVTVSPCVLYPLYLLCLLVYGVSSAPHPKPSTFTLCIVGPPMDKPGCGLSVHPAWCTGMSQRVGLLMLFGWAVPGCRCLCCSLCILRMQIQIKDLDIRVRPNFTGFALRKLVETLQDIGDLDNADVTPPRPPCPPFHSSGPYPSSHCGFHPSPEVHNTHARVRLSLSLLNATQLLVLTKTSKIPSLHTLSKSSGNRRRNRGGQLSLGAQALRVTELSHFVQS